MKNWNYMYVHIPGLVWCTRVLNIATSSPTPKTRCKFITTNLGSYLAAFCLIMDRQFLLFYKSGAWSFKF